MAALIARVVPIPPVRGRGWLLVERNLMVYRHDWLVLVSGFFEPLFYLLSIGVGIAPLVGNFQVGGHAVSYPAFIAPAMLAASAMNGAIADTTYNLFFKLKYAKLYDAVLATPLRPVDIATGEICWALIRGGLYSAAFLLTMLALGLVFSWWAVLALPAAVLVGFAFAAAGMAGTTFMRSWQDFEFISLAILPMFLLSATFFPLSTYPPVVRLLVELTPLYHGVALLRALTLGTPSWQLLVSVAYLAAMAGVSLWVSSRRIGRVLLK
ncbi:ABC transporter permease [Actinopolymorpha alba]|uniref:ABC transporter permease n=1 Tax=Actinopolymorpha alba TaxID=533267 RepID=UPI000366400D|nr:ABC transporter permease [Actinopolymorpha alba]